MQWLRNYRRKKILRRPFPKSWKSILKSRIIHFARLTPDEKRRFQELVQVFIAEKNWKGCGGLKITDEMKVTIAAQACLLILNLPQDLYRNIHSILVYPSAVYIPEQKLGFFEIAREPIRPAMPISGEAHVQGPVVLVWDEIKKSTRHPKSGHNVVFHEFAHKLDMLDGSADGVPPLQTKKEYQRWSEILGKEFNELTDRVQKGNKTWLDAYAALDEAEFFAVMTEYFFDRPSDMKLHHPDCYEMMSGFYRQDPARYENSRRKPVKK